MRRRKFFRTIAAWLAGSAGAVGITTLSAAPALSGLDEEALLEEALLEFYGGDQWPAEAKAIREKQGRPCIVMNVLPAIVKRRCAAERKYTGQAISAGRLREIILHVTRRCRDTQLLHNYYLSAALECSVDARRARANLLDPLMQYGETPRITRELAERFEQQSERCLELAHLASPSRVSL